jgi:preprotein translocase subunit SecB
MQIRFKHIQFTELETIVKTLDKNVTSELETSLNIDNAFNDENLNEFIVNFYIKIENSEKNFQLKLKAIAQFSTKEDVTDEFKKSPFIEINAPAIAFPYVRTFISNLTLNMGYNPILLPTFNFVELSKK